MSGTTGKLGRAWVGALVGAWVVYGCMMDLSIGEGLDGDGALIGVVSGCEIDLE